MHSGGLLLAVATVNYADILAERKACRIEILGRCLWMGTFLTLMYHCSSQTRKKENLEDKNDEAFKGQ